MERHFVTFYSPGTVFAETTTEPIEAWNPEVALKMAGRIKERYNATPYAFRFTTRKREEADLDSKEAARSGMYYFNGELETLKDVEARHGRDGGLETLLANMKANRWKQLVVGPKNGQGWKWCQPFEEGDILLDSSSTAVVG